jgi:hypothetical protein
MNKLEILPELKHLDHVNKMISRINDNQTLIDRATMHFGKRQSQFMDNMLTLSHPTPYRNLRQILSEIENSRLGLQESYFKHEKSKLALSNLLDKKSYFESLEDDDFERNKLHEIDLEIREIQAGLKYSEKYIVGAIRRIHNHLDQYENILAELKKQRGITELTEKDFEEEEEKYHIKTAYAQALTAARSRNGVIDEGNHIYFFQIGINGAVAQMNILKYLKWENTLLEDNKIPTHEDILEFLEKVYQNHKGCSLKYAKFKNIKLNNNQAILGKL